MLHRMNNFNKRLMDTAFEVANQNRVDLNEHDMFINIDKRSEVNSLF